MMGLNAEQGSLLSANDCYGAIKDIEPSFDGRWMGEVGNLP